MAAIGSEEWFEHLEGALAEVELGDLTIEMSHVVEKTPEGKVSWTELWSDGRLEALQTKASKSAAVAFTTKWPDFCIHVSGQRTPSAMFMQGRLKVSGDMKAFLALLPIMDRESYRSALTQIGDATDS